MGADMAFTKQDLEAYCAAHGIAGLSRDYVLETAERPSRLASAQGFNSVACEYPSRKMGRSIVGESRTGEHAYSLMLEYDPTVTAYFDQPPPVECIRRDRKGRRGPRLYTPDFLVLRTSGPRVIEVKSAKELEDRLAQYPEDWVRNDDGVVQDLPAVEAYASLGFVHQVVSIADISQTYVANVRLLMQARSLDVEPSPQFEKQVFAKLSSQATMTMAELAASLGIKDLTAILRMIDQGVLFADLMNCLLALPETTLVSTGPELLDVPDTVERNDKQVPITTVLTRRQAERALAILERMHSGVGGRSTFRYRKLIDEGASKGLSPLQSVVPKFHLRGNRTPKRPAAVLEALDRFVEAHWATPDRPTGSAALRLYRTHAHQEHPGVPPVSSATFRRKLESAHQTSAMGRGGIRAANAAASPTNVLSRSIPAMRPFEMASCDHYLCDVHLRVLAGERSYTALPWLTVLIDVATSLILGFSLGFMSPSRTSCALALRDVVRRFGRLPEQIVVDRGSEFRSIYFSALLAHCGVTQVVRPTSHPRFGSEAERFFGLFKSEWLSLRPGNTVSKVESRAVSAGHQPQDHAELDLGGLHAELGQYVGWRARRVRNARDSSPAVEFAQLMQRFPFSGVAVEDNADFHVASCVDEARVSFDPSRGLQIADPKLWYWSPALAGLKPRTRVEVRRDPENIYVIYARVGNVWEPCYSSGQLVHAHEDPARSRQRSIALYTSRELRKQARQEEDSRLIAQLFQAEKKRAELEEPARQLQDSAPADPFEVVRGSEVAVLPSKDWGEP